MQTRELFGLRYRCLEGCGYCCTFAPEASPTEVAALRAKFPALPLTRPAGAAGTTLLALQGSCGACALLKDRNCTAYDERPAHCRYFPFHVYFGRRTEVNVNRCCRGVEEAGAQADGAGPQPNLLPEFQSHVLGQTSTFQLNKRQAAATAAHARFERAARAAGMWCDVDAELGRLLGRGVDWFRPHTWPPTPTGEQDEAGSPTEAWHLALAPLSEEEPARRPFYLAADLQWLTFRCDANTGTVAVDTMDETGRMRPWRDLGAFDDWPALPSDVASGLLAVLHRLARRDLMAGSVFHLVDQTRYDVSVADAAAIRLGDTAAELALRADLLHRLGVPWDQVPAEAGRFYDPAFLDCATIGTWL